MRREGRQRVIAELREIDRYGCACIGQVVATSALPVGTFPATGEADLWRMGWPWL
ncbi:hypothetical protein GCM10011411_23490 [Aurantiacibacter arachoides]|nr:hypothetical protein GCM10011411_23490 [Aurantiacibacter arachoides]